MKLKPRKKTSHKGQNGKVLVIGGSVDYAGAPAFVGESALAVLRTGADLVTIAAPEKVAWAINSLSPDLITKKLPGSWLRPAHLKQVLDLSRIADVVVIGNGTGLRKETQEFIKAFVQRVKKPVIIDADALKVVRLQDVHNAILTPHGGEWKALLMHSRLEGTTTKKIQKMLNNNILVLKGHPKTQIISKTKTAINKTGTAGMTHGGTGDVLAGIIAGLIAQGNDPFTSCKMATYVNGKIGEILHKKMGFGYLASDMVKQIPFILKKFQRLI